MSSILEGLMDKKIENVLNVFIKNKGELFHLQKISQQSKVPIASSFRLMKRLTNAGFVTVIRIGKFKVYKLAENKKTRVLSGLLGNRGVDKG